MTINDVFTAPEAAELWGLAKDTVKQACIDSMKGVKKNPFLQGEYRKSGGAWLVTREGMERLYGPRLNADEEQKLMSQAYY